MVYESIDYWKVSSKPYTSLEYKMEMFCNLNVFLMHKENLTSLGEFIYYSVQRAWILGKKEHVRTNKMLQVSISQYLWNCIFRIIRFYKGAQLGNQKMSGFKILVETWWAWSSVGQIVFCLLSNIRALQDATLTGIGSISNNKIVKGARMKCYGK